MDATLATPAGRPAPRRLALRAFAASVAALAAAGALLASQSLHGVTPQAASPPIPTRSAPAIGDPVATPFGFAAVLGAHKTSGLTERQVGMTHGVQGFVGAGQAQIEVSVELTNTTQGTASYSARSFALRTGRSKRLRMPVSGTVGRGQLQPGASVELQLDYVVPRNGNRLWLAIGDAKAPGHLVDLGRIARASAATAHTTHH
jgi:hypothetical protein